LNVSGSLDPYKVLGLDRNASLEEIRQAYRRAATKYHPDAGGDAWAFQQVQQAYDELRAQHDLAQQAAGSRRTANSATTSKSATSKSTRPNYTKPESGTKPEAGSGGSSTLKSNTSGRLFENWRHWLFGKPLRLHNETSYFIFANFMDLVMTAILLRYSAVEANPIANFFYLKFGFVGMVGLKIATVALVCFVTQSIARRNELKARILLVAGTLVVAAVVVYSIFLARNQVPHSILQL
jgi:hypothetical protein